jgi:vancomycin permeability regulator SanA
MLPVSGPAAYKNSNYSGVRSQESVVRMRKLAKTFEDLLVWQKVHLFALAVYRLSMAFPKHEIYSYSES